MTYRRFGIHRKAGRRQALWGLLLSVLPFSCADAGHKPPLARAEISRARAAPRAEGVPRPIVRQYNYVIEFDHCAVEIDPADGGRIVAFSLDGRSVVLARDESPDAYGSSFWPSPQGDWVWPPPVALDKAEWKASIEGASLVLASGTDAKLGLSAKQRIAADMPRAALAIEYTLTNAGTVPRRVAPWQNTRVRPNGVTFFPSPTPALPISSLKLAPVEGIVWFSHVPASIKESSKLFADGSEGWIAQVEGDLVFVKVFPDVPREAQAPGEGEIEIYVHESGRFVEVEQQGAYVELAPGESSTWTVRWLVRRLPEGIGTEPRNRKLVDYVRCLVASLR
jgi:hypothetical protein